ALHSSAGHEKPFRNLFSERPRKSQPRSVLENDDLVPAKPRLEFMNAIDIHNQPAMDTNERGRVETLLEIRKRFANHVHHTSDVQLHIIAGALAPVDFVRPHKKDSAVSTN